MTINIYIILNKISFECAKEIIKNKKYNIFFYNKRCNIKRVDKIFGLYFDHNRISNFFLELFLKLFGKYCILYIPHTKLDKGLLNCLKYCDNICLIPDGMDFYREVPLNIDFKYFNYKKNILYIDSHELERALWLNNFKKSIFINPKYLDGGDINYPTIPPGSLIIVESPGVDYLINNNLMDHGKEVYYIPHPAVGKRSIPNKNFRILDLSKDKISLENFLANQSHMTVYFGETYSAILLLSTDFYKKNIVKLIISKSQSNNITTYVQLLKKSGVKIFEV